MRGAIFKAFSIAALAFCFTAAAHADGIDSTTDSLPISVNHHPVIQLYNNSTGVTAEFLGAVNIDQTLAISGISYFASPIGIGTPNPAAALELVPQGDTWGFGGILIRGGLPALDGQLTAPGIIFSRDQEADFHLGASVGVAQHSGQFLNDAQPGDLSIKSALGGDVRIGGSWNVNPGPTFFIMKNSGNIGIHTNDPQATLDVNGSIRESKAGGTIYGLNPGNFGGKEAVFTTNNGQGDDSDEVWIGPNTNAWRGNIQLVANKIFLHSSDGGGTQKGYIYLYNGMTGFNTTSPIGTVDIENGTGTATLCLNGNCISSLTSLVGPAGPPGPPGQPGAQGPPGSAANFPSCADGQMLIYSGGVPTCTTPSNGAPVIVQGTSDIVGAAAHDNYIQQGAWLLYGKNGNTSDQQNLLNGCLWGSDSLSDADWQQKIKDPTCQIALCVGFFDKYPQLYSLVGFCGPGSQGAQCQSMFGGLPTVNESCFFMAGQSNI